MSSSGIAKLRTNEVQVSKPQPQKGTYACPNDSNFEMPLSPIKIIKCGEPLPSTNAGKASDMPRGACGPYVSDGLHEAGGDAGEALLQEALPHELPELLRPQPVHVRDEPLRQRGLQHAYGRGGAPLKTAKTAGQLAACIADWDLRSRCLRLPITPSHKQTSDNCKKIKSDMAMADHYSYTQLVYS